jgi:glycine/D-amino acid oxidase-like deaminating enzyme
MIGALPDLPDAWVIGCVHSGYTSGPYMGKLLAQAMLGEEPELPLFDPARLVVPVEALAQPHREKTE